ncbi:carboxypeptidase regulatory-like domain-containing protein [Planctomicrobium sp. SH664]|uniref:carboxypeptidase regulatory-like domain-containing protein n=1 Tax=Planctomicrobium sp. SH664 TaxID=3448125 RepID=UPI003F5C473E
MKLPLSQPILIMTALVLTVALTGCGRNGPELGRVRGQVTMDGKPVPRAQVTLEPEGPGRGAAGLANENGEYVMEYAPATAGALVGPVIVRISTLTIDHPETIPAKYNLNSELRRTVEPGENVFNFELVSK